MKRLTLFFVVLLAGVTAALAQNYPPKSDYLWYTVPDHKDWLYKVGEKASIDVMFLKYGMPQDGIVDYEVSDEGSTKETVKGKLTLKDGKAVITGITSDKPGFRDIRLKFKQGKTTYRYHVKIGFSTEKIEPYTKEPSDFVSWWENDIRESEKYPLKYTKELIKEHCTDKVDCYLVKIEINRHHQSMYGYLMCPKNAKPGSCPVLLSPPGAGIKPYRQPNGRDFIPENGIIRFAVEIHGINPNYDDATYKDLQAAFDGKVKGYLYQGIDCRENYYLRHVYEGLVKCIDFLTSLPEWDGKNVIALGGSQGGGLSIAAAGLDKRVTHLVINHPALADMGRAAEGGVSGFPHFSAKDNMLTPDKLKTMSYYDAVNFARHITAKTYMTWGYNDNTCPPTTSYAVWNTLKCPKESLITPINEHWISGTTNEGQLTWLLDHLNK